MTATALVTGAGGRLGRELVRSLGDAGYEVHGRTRGELDVGDEAAVDAAVRDLQPDVVCNAAARTDVDGCEDDPHGAHRVNALGPWWLARSCATLGATLLHVSTDAVFSGPAATGPDGRPRPWTEFDPVAPLGVYARSKAAGEQLVRASCPQHHIVRVAWLLDREGDDFVGAVSRIARRDGRVEVVTDQVGSPTWIGTLGSALVELLERGRHGTVHRTGVGAVDRVQLARTALRSQGIEAEVVPVDAAARGDRAPRPPWSPLDPTHAELSGLAPLGSWQQHLEAALRARGTWAGGHGGGPA